MCSQYTAPRGCGWHWKRNTPGSLKTHAVSPITAGGTQRGLQEGVGCNIQSMEKPPCVLSRKNGENISSKKLLLKSLVVNWIYFCNSSTCDYVYPTDINIYTTTLLFASGGLYLTSATTQSQIYWFCWHLQHSLICRIWFERLEGLTWYTGCNKVDFSHALCAVPPKYISQLHVWSRCSPQCLLIDCSVLLDLDIICASKNTPWHQARERWFASHLVELQRINRGKINVTFKCWK